MQIEGLTTWHSSELPLIPGDGLVEMDVIYISEAQPVFEDLRQVVNQLAGLMLITETVRSHGFVVRDLLVRSNELFDEARQHFGRLRPGPRSQHHRLHLHNAISCLESTLVASRELASGLGLETAGLKLLNAAWRELVSASNALPGFERVDLSQSCCAQHFTMNNPAIVTCEGNKT